MISKNTATDIALAYREIERAEELLVEVKKRVEERSQVVPRDIRDAFGRPVGALQLGIPSGPGSHRLMDVPFSLAIPIIEAHIAHHQAMIKALTDKARIEIVQDPLP